MRAKESFDDAKVFQAICGLMPITKSNAAGMVEREFLQSHFLSEFEDIPNIDELEMCVQTVGLRASPASRPRVNVTPLTKVVNSHGAFGIDSVTRITFRPVPSRPDALGWGIQPMSTSVMIGKKLRVKASRLSSARSNDRDFANYCVQTKWGKLGDRKVFDKAIKALMAPVKAVSAELVDEAKTLGLTGWGDKTQIQQRRLVLFACHSMLPLDRQLLAIGRGKDMRRSAFSALSTQLRKVWGRGIKPVHADSLPHWWFDQYQRLGLNLKVPFIQYR